MLWISNQVKLSSAVLVPNCSNENYNDAGNVNGIDLLSTTVCV